MPEAPTAGRKRAARAASGGTTTGRARKPQAIRQRPASELSPAVPAGQTLVAEHLSAPMATAGAEPSLVATHASHETLSETAVSAPPVPTADPATELAPHDRDRDSLRDLGDELPSAATVSDSFAQRLNEALAAISHAQARSHTAFSDEPSEPTSPLASHPGDYAEPSPTPPERPSAPEPLAVAVAPQQSVHGAAASVAPAVRPIASAPRAAAAYGQVHAPAAAQSVITPDDVAPPSASAQDAQPSRASARDAQPCASGDAAEAASSAGAGYVASAERGNGAAEGDGAERAGDAARGGGDMAARHGGADAARQRGGDVAARRGGADAARGGADVAMGGEGVGGRWRAWLVALDRMPPIRLPIGPPIPWRLGLPLLIALVAAVTLVGRASAPSSAETGKVRLPAQEIYAVQADGPLFAASSSGDGQPQPSSDLNTAATTRPTDMAAATSARAAAQAPQAIGVAEPAAMNIDILDIGLKLAAVLGLAYGSLVLLKKAGLGGSGRASLHSGHSTDGLKVLSTVALAPNRTVHTLRLPDGRTLVIGATPNSVNLLTELTDLDDVADVDDANPVGSVSSVLDGLRAHLR